MSILKKLQRVMNEMSGDNGQYVSMDCQQYIKNIERYLSTLNPQHIKVNKGMIKNVNGSDRTKVQGQTTNTVSYFQSNPQAVVTTKDGRNLSFVVMFMDDNTGNPVDYKLIDNEKMLTVAIVFHSVKSPKVSHEYINPSNNQSFNMSLDSADDFNKGAVYVLKNPAIMGGAKDVLCGVWDKYFKPQEQPKQQQ